MPAIERCLCGHDKATHHFTGDRLCTVCSVTSRGWLTGECMGWNPPGGGDHARREVGLDPTGPAVTRVGGAAGPPDLDHATQERAFMAAIEAMMLGVGDDAYRAYHVLARLAVEAAAPVLLQATQDRLADLERLLWAYVAEHDAIQPWEWAERFRAALDLPTAQEEGG